MNNQNPSLDGKTKNITLTSTLAWLFGIILAITGIANIFSSPISALFLLLATVIIIPPIMQTISQKSKVNLSRNVKIVLVIGFLALAGFNMKSSASTSTPTVTAPNSVQNSAFSNTQPVKENTGDKKIISIVFAKKVIKDMLKSPSTAKFSNVASYELSNKKDVWAVNGYVDSQNSFGAMIRNIWEVQLDYRDGSGGTVLSILFDGKNIQ